MDRKGREGECEETLTLQRLHCILFYINANLDLTPLPSPNFLRPPVYVFIILLRVKQLVKEVMLQQVQLLYYKLRPFLLLMTLVQPLVNYFLSLFLIHQQVLLVVQLQLLQ